MIQKRIVSVNYLYPNSQRTDRCCVVRKARMHATELARERDTLNAATETLRNELTDAKHEVVTVRRSIVEEKQSLEQKLDEERKAKERARQQLDSRMDELQRRKSKFACL